MTFKPENVIWTEKYRPKKVSEMVGDFRIKILKYLEKPEAIPHFLFYSKTPGTGKTTLAKAIINELDCDALIINSSDDRKIETVREKVKEFARTQSSKGGLRRCIFLDEFDGMLSASQNALRNIMETYSKNVFFILTCNNINKIIDPLKSRCVTLAFAYPDKQETVNYLKIICESEHMLYDDEGLMELVKKNYPSIRNCVLALQDLYTEEKSVTIENVKPSNPLFKTMWNMLIDKKWKEIKEVVMATTVDPRELNTFFWMNALEDENLKLIQVCCRNEKDISQGADPKVVFVTSIIEMCK